MTEKYFEVEIRDPAAISAQERKAERKERRRKERRRATIQRVILASALLILVAIVAARALPEAGCTETPPTPAPVERVETRDTVAIIDPDMDCWIRERHRTRRRPPPQKRRTQR